MPVLHHRLWQAVLAPRRPSPADEAEAEQVLGPLAPLLRDMLPYDRAHACRVYRRVRRDQPADPVLWQAALLHDCGKAGVRPGLGLRAAGVLARRFRGFAPGRLGHYLRHETESVSRLRAAGAAREVWEAVAALAQPEGLPPAAAERARRLRIADDAE